ncbi:MULTISPECIES: hypothetical protein [Planktothrix]|jgi:hypothetical protein|uniref:Uncharacterized protein n=3 Tax=Planktothrix TaxID=54304 RepID=A0A4P5ZTU1_PLAAG|nr:MULTISPECIES: hypothetical protein [Planktothrix]CAD5929646.1 hypothetical protein NO108_01586 [Planktothrix rubescens]CAC5340882.1 conserved hypothetical protein [Planktothrix rubescens NIVA-CYA 18]CAD0219490.1 conserved hypothetical protein [Planktothrix agardhii]CAD5937212.1 hypothetical protein PCC7821_01670 [Planktothrix rubescens NIVA-CYA 18]CAD5939037.1 hypothetical protein NO758_01783 [Planktothrix agardhii]
MPRGSFAQLNNTTTTQITFYYDNGHEESFSVPIPPVELVQQLPELLHQAWLTFHLIDQTVMVNMAKVDKVELKPPVPELQGQGIFLNSQRVTALHRGAVGRLKMAE